MRTAFKFLPYLLDSIRFRWLAFNLYAIASVFSVSLRLQGFTLSANYVIASIGLGLLITAVTASLLIAGFSAIRQLKNYRSLAIVPMLLFVGAIRGALLYYEIEYFNFENRLQILSSVISSTFYTAIYYIGASLSVELLSSQKTRIRDEFNKATEIRLGLESPIESESIDFEYRKSMDSIRDAIKLRLPDNSLQKPDSHQISEVASEIRDQIQMVLRPLSHRLWFDANGQLRNVSKSRTLLDAIKYLDFSPKFILAYQVLVGIFGIGLSIGFRDAVIKTLIAGSASILCFRIFRFLERNESWNWISRTSLFLLLTGAFPVIASEGVSDFIGINTNWVAGAIVSPTLPALIVINSIFLLVLRDQQFVLSAAKSVTENQRTALEQNGTQISMKEMSGYLHNNLQSELLRISKQLESSSLDEVRTSQLISELEGALQRTIQDVQEIRKRGFERLTALADAWQGIADISLEIELLANLEQDVENVIAGAVEEMITNSIRYGDASSIDVRVSDIPRLAITVTHNGSGQLHSENGLGSIWLSSIAIGGITLDKNQGVTTYSVIF